MAVSSGDTVQVDLHMLSVIGQLELVRPNLRNLETLSRTGRAESLPLGVLLDHILPLSDVRIELS